MACVPHYCDNHVVVCPSGHRPPCAANTPLPVWIPSTIANTTLQAAQIQGLRNYMNNEISQWRLHPWYYSLPLITASFEAGTPIEDSEWDNMYTTFFNIGNPPNDNSPLSDTFWVQMIDQYNYKRVECICNVDCSCNAVCGCHVDCGCNYAY